MLKDKFNFSDLLHKLKTTLFYFGASVIGFIISIVTYPLFAKYLNIDEFAAVNYFTNYSGFFGFLFSLNLYVFYSSVFFKLDNENAERSLKAFMIVLLVWNLLALGIVYLLSIWILENVLHVKFEVTTYLFYSLAAVSAVSLRSIVLIKLRLQKKAFHFFLISTMAKIGVVLLSLYFVMYYKPTGDSRLLGALVSEVISTLIIFIYIFKGGGFSWPKMEFREMFTFIWPLLLASVVYYPAMGLDQVILERYVSKAELGLYSIGLGFAGYLHTFNFSVYQTIEPDIIRAKAQSDSASLKKHITLLLGVAIFTTICFCLTSKYLIDFMSHGKFTAAYKVANILSISFLFVLLFSVGNTLLTVSGNSKAVLLTNFIGLIAITGFCLLLKSYNSYGIAAARVLTYLTLAISSFLILKKLSRKSQI